MRHSKNTTTKGRMLAIGAAILLATPAALLASSGTVGSRSHRSSGHYHTSGHHSHHHSSGSSTYRSSRRPQVSLSIGGGAVRINSSRNHHYNASHRGTYRHYGTTHYTSSHWGSPTRYSYPSRTTRYRTPSYRSSPSTIVVYGSAPRIDTSVRTATTQESLRNQELWQRSLIAERQLAEAQRRVETSQERLAAERDLSILRDREQAQRDQVALERERIELERLRLESRNQGDQPAPQAPQVTPQAATQTAVPAVEPLTARLSRAAGQPEPAVDPLPAGWRALADGRTAAALATFTERSQQADGTAMDRVGFALASLSSGDATSTAVGLRALKRALQGDTDALGYLAVDAKLQSALSALADRLERQAAGNPELWLAVSVAEFLALDDDAAARAADRAAASAPSEALSGLRALLGEAR